MNSPLCHVYGAQQTKGDFTAKALVHTAIRSLGHI